MDNIRATIDLMFNHRRAESIIDSHLEPFALGAHTTVDQDWFVRHFRYVSKALTNDQADAVYKILINKWLKSSKENISQYEGPSTVFNLLIHFTNSILIISGNEPKCRYEQLLRWHEMSSKVGQDLLTTSYLAWKEIDQAQERRYFSWRPVITHDNPALTHIMKKGVADLHFHLKGSSLNFELNWLSLMNSIEGRRFHFNKIEKTILSPEIHTNRDDKTHSLHAMCVKACAIRLLIFKKLFELKTDKEQFEKFVDTVIKQDSNSIVRFTAELNREVTTTKYLLGHRYGNNVIDYAIPKNFTQIENIDQQSYTNSVLSGERRLMYGAFRKIYSGDPDFLSISDLFYAYLVIKEKLRHEIVQLNGKAGFGNFDQYEKRKDIFISKGSIYDTLLNNLAINSTIVNQSISYLEARITPKNNHQEIVKTIRNLDCHIYDRRFIVPQRLDFNSIYKVDNSHTKPPNFYYIFHFIKEAPKTTQNNIHVSARNHKARSKVKQQATAINKFRQTSIQRVGRVVGIDAANTEIGCRAEVFAQAFRYLKDQSVAALGSEYIAPLPRQTLGRTYHVGEDYLDIADGLRAIDESIYFLDLKRGDRLGHALALGVDAERYYSERHYTVVMPKQDFLDNVVWVMAKSNELGLSLPSDLKFKLKNWYQQYFRDIYDDKPPAFFTYYQSWLLRGDCPVKYLDDNTPTESYVTCWDKYALNKSCHEIISARNNIEACRLYYQYHYNANARRKGEISDEYKICSNYIAMISSLQQKMCGKIAKLHIGIEANPSSNNIIGALERYSAHPVTKFYNHGLEAESIQTNECPQISVSINTDDQGVFCTSVENEFAIMALSMEKQMKSDKSMVYKPRMVYQWIDNVRELAFEQTFYKPKFLQEEFERL